MYLSYIYSTQQHSAWPYAVTSITLNNSPKESVNNTITGSGVTVSLSFFLRKEGNYSRRKQKIRVLKELFRGSRTGRRDTFLSFACSNLQCEAEAKFLLADNYSTA